MSDPSPSQSPSEPQPGSGLTTTEAPFIEQAQRRGELFISQPYELYSPENHQTWGRLYERMADRWARYANEHFLEGLARLHFDRGAVPRLDDVNRFLQPLTGFTARAVSGYIPAFQFFDSISRLEFPTTITIRSGRNLDYLPEPDIFHDIAGHVPMHTDPAFAQTLVRLGGLARMAAERARSFGDSEDPTARLSSILRAITRFFWFSIEFGLMDNGSGVRAYGSGLLSSYGELAHAIDAREVQRHPFQLEWVVNQGFQIDSYQPLLFVVESFDELFDWVGQLETWLMEGRLDNVALGDPDVGDDELSGFLEASGT